MSQDLTGDDAFDKVLDRLVEAEKRAATAQEAQNGSRHEIAALQQTLNNIRSDLTTSKIALERYQRADDAIINLYTRIENACQVLGAQSAPLREALAEAKKFIDPIPF